MKKFFVVVVVGLWWSGVVWAGCDHLVAFGMPKVKSNGEISATVLCRRMYVIEHNDERHSAWWSAERLIGSQQDEKSERINAFRADPDLPDGVAAKVSDYLKSGWDKGHLAPVGDMHADPKAMIESFYLSNIVPQLPANNRVGWRSLETYVRKQAIVKGELFVITGPIYQGKVTKTIGTTAVAIPSHLYKIVYDPKTNEALSFVVPNIPVKWMELTHFVTNVATVEQLTGINFFPLAINPIKNSYLMW